MNSRLALIKVVLLCLCGAVGYGIVHDQVTARLCIEYFTVAHPPLIHSASPTLIGLFWGVAATFGVGIALGVPLAMASQSPSPQPPAPLTQVGKSILALLAIMAVAAVFFGVIGFELSRRGIVSVPVNWADDIPVSQHPRFIAVWFAHGASYLCGFVGGAYLIFTTWNQRGRPAILHVFPQSGLGALRTFLVVAAAGVILWFRFFRH